MPADDRTPDTYRHARLKAAAAKGPEERRRAAHMAAWTRMPGNDDAQHPCSNPHGSAHP
jgi:hypothetical protein